MIRKHILAAILGVVLGPPPASAWTPICTPADEIRQRFIADGGSAAIVSDPRGVDVVTQAIRDQKAPAAEVSDRYLVVAMRGIVLIYPLRDGKVCAAGTKGIVPIMGQAAADLVRRLQATCGVPI